MDVLVHRTRMTRIERIDADLFGFIRRSATSATAVAVFDTLFAIMRPATVGNPVHPIDYHSKFSPEVRFSAPGSN
jgi:hypothetical protein